MKFCVILRRLRAKINIHGRLRENSIVCVREKNQSARERAIREITDSFQGAAKKESTWRGK